MVCCMLQSLTGGIPQEGLRFTPEALEALLDTLDIKNVEVARLCGVNPTTIQRWLNGHTPIPHAVIRMLTLMVLLRQFNDVVKVPNAA